MPRRDWPLLLDDMLQSIEKIGPYGEAPGVDWRGIIGLRNRVIHESFGLLVLLCHWR